MSDMINAIPNSDAVLKKIKSRNEYVNDYSTSFGPSVELWTNENMRN